MASLEEKIKELEDYQTYSNQPSIEALTEYVTYETGSFGNPLNFDDRDGFKTRFASEAKNIAELVCIAIFLFGFFWREKPKTRFLRRQTPVSMEYTKFLCCSFASFSSCVQSCTNQPTSFNVE